MLTDVEKKYSRMQYPTLITIRWGYLPKAYSNNHTYGKTLGTSDDKTKLLIIQEYETWPSES